MGTTGRASPTTRYIRHLARLFHRYLDFEFNWSGHAGDQALGFYDWLVEESIGSFREAIGLLGHLR